MDIFEKEVRNRLRNLDNNMKVYLKKNYKYEVFEKHNITDDEINFIFDMKKITKIYPNAAFPERVDIIINATKGKTIKVIIQFGPILKEEKLLGKVGIITAFKI
ncbi:hypothetical protein HZA96_06620 [Candidatus Woesearchaeota archaeon]|nr:hypothetical protein [Candidatus Woesearchaeota archaeon]